MKTENKRNCRDIINLIRVKKNFIKIVSKNNTADYQMAGKAERKVRHRLNSGKNGARE